MNSVQLSVMRVKHLVRIMIAIVRIDPPMIKRSPDETIHGEIDNNVGEKARSASHKKERKTK